MMQSAEPSNHAPTIRFPFGKNWRSFLSLLDERRIAEAEDALRESLGRDSLHGWRVLDIGSGSGLSSLAMLRLGARVVSFDYDTESVACTSELRRRFASSGDDWEVLSGSVLDSTFMRDLGKFDLVYAWGVLHHTGSMWRALTLTHERVAPEGILLLALYNDQGSRSRVWRHIKRVYCGGPFGRVLVTAVFYPLFAAYALAIDFARLRLPGNHIRDYLRGRRGMSIVHDWRDWLGGYPFEVARPTEVRARLEAANFTFLREKITRGWGCNEFVVQRQLDSTTTESPVVKQPLAGSADGRRPR